MKKKKRRNKYIKCIEKAELVIFNVKDDVEAISTNL